MNINHSDIMEIEIPLLPINRQQEMIAKYNEEFTKKPLVKLKIDGKILKTVSTMS